MTCFSVFKKIVFLLLCPIAFAMDTSLVSSNLGGKAGINEQGIKDDVLSEDIQVRDIELVDLYNNVIPTFLSWEIAHNKSTISLKLGENYKIPNKFYTPFPYEPYREPGMDKLFHVPGNVGEWKRVIHKFKGRKEVHEWVVNECDELLTELEKNKKIEVINEDFIFNDTISPKLTNLKLSKIEQGEAKTKSLFQSLLKRPEDYTSSKFQIHKIFQGTATNLLNESNVPLPTPIVKKRSKKSSRYGLSDSDESSEEKPKSKFKTKLRTISDHEKNAIIKFKNYHGDQLKKVNDFLALTDLITIQAKSGLVTLAPKELFEKSSDKDKQEEIKKFFLKIKPFFLGAQKPAHKLIDVTTFQEKALGDLEIIVCEGDLDEEAETSKGAGDSGVSGDAAFEHKGEEDDEELDVDSKFVTYSPLALQSHLPEREKEEHQVPSHGLAVAGIIGAGDFLQQLKGVAPGAKILPINDINPGTLKLIEKSRARVINLSVAVTFPATCFNYLKEKQSKLSSENKKCALWWQFANLIKEKDMVVVVAAGNEGLQVEEVNLETNKAIDLTNSIKGMQFEGNVGKDYKGKPVDIDIIHTFRQIPQLKDRVILVGNLRADGVTVAPSSNLPGAFPDDFIFVPSEDVLSLRSSEIGEQKTIEKDDKGEIYRDENNNRVYKIRAKNKLGESTVRYNSDPDGQGNDIDVKKVTPEYKSNKDSAIVTNPVYSALGKFGGTSGAAPRATGVMALLGRIFPGLTMVEIRSCVLATGDSFWESLDNRFTWGQTICNSGIEYPKATAESKRALFRNSRYEGTIREGHAALEWQDWRLDPANKLMSTMSISDILSKTCPQERAETAKRIFGQGRMNAKAAYLKCLEMNEKKKGKGMGRGMGMLDLSRPLSQPNKENPFYRIMSKPTPPKSTAVEPLLREIKAYYDQHPQSKVIDSFSGVTLPLREAINLEKGWPGLVKILLEAKNKPKLAQKEATDILGEALLDPDMPLELFHYLLNNGANPDEKYKGKTPLLIAMASNKEELVKLLIDSGADLKFPDGTPLLIAAVQKDLNEQQLNFVRYILEKNKQKPDPNIDPNVKWDNKTPLSIIVFQELLTQEMMKFAKLLLSYGANPNEDFDGKSLLAEACRYQFIKTFGLDFVKLLLSYKANPNVEGWNTPFYIAMKSNNYELATLLIENGVDLNPPNGDSPLILTLQQKPDEQQLDFVKYLLEKKKADPNVKKNIQTPLSSILPNENGMKIAEQLLKVGANPDGVRGQPLVEACKPEMVKVFGLSLVKLLLDHGANPNVISSGYYSEGIAYNELLAKAEDNAPLEDFILKAIMENTKTTAHDKAVAFWGMLKKVPEIANFIEGGKKGVETKKASNTFVYIQKKKKPRKKNRYATSSEESGDEDKRESEDKREKQLLDVLQQILKASPEVANASWQEQLTAAQEKIKGYIKKSDSIKESLPEVEKISTKKQSINKKSIMKTDREKALDMLKENPSLSVDDILSSIKK